MTSSDFDIDLAAVRKFLADKEVRRQKILDKRFQQATDDCAQIVKKIIDDYAPRRIWQWGSLLDRRRFSEISDIDLALEGLSGPEEFFKIIGDAMELTNFPVDIVELEKIEPENADYIRETGKLIYENHQKR